jgi:DNA-binding beta-propeller fold protein YncE
MMAQDSKSDFELEVVPGFFKPPTDGNLIQPTGVAVNSHGHIFIFNKGNRKLMEFDTEGTYLRSFGDGLFIDPHGLRIDSEDNIWTTDLEAHTVLKLNPDGQVLMVIGQNKTSGLFDEARNSVLFFKPADIGFRSNGDIYVADGYGNHRIVQLDKEGNFIRAWGKKGPEQGNFDNPHNIIVDRNRVYVADRYNKRIQVFDTDGKFVDAWTHLGIPWGLAISPERNLYLVDGDAEVIYKLSMDGKVIGKYEAGPGRAAGHLRAAHGIAAGPQEELYITEVLNWRVQKFQQHWHRGDWERIITANCANHRHESAFAELDGKFYAFGGRNTHTVDIYDPVTRTWSSGADSPLEMHHFQAFSYKGEIWVVGAFTGPYPKEEPIAFLYAYNPEKDSWRAAGRLPDGRHRGAGGVVVYKDKFYLLCGNEVGHYTGHTTWFDEFDPATGEWTAMPDAPHTRDHFQAAVLDGKLYAAGGRNSSSKTNSVIDATFPETDVFDFATRTWSTLPSSGNIPTQRAGCTVVVDKNRVIVMGGESGTQVEAHSDVEALDVQSNTWSKLPPMIQGRHGTQAIHYGERIYIAAGSGDRGGGPELKSIDCWKLD